MHRTLVLWVASLTWHLWRIATLRPAFRYLSDTWGVMGSFLLLFYGSGLWRWWGASGEAHIALVSFNLTLYLLTLIFLLERQDRSRSLLAVALGVSVVFDLSMTLLFLTGTVGSVRTPHAWLDWLECAAVVFMWWRFTQEPPEVQRKGHGRKNPRPAQD